MVAQKAFLGDAGLLQEDWLTRIRLDLIWKLDLVLLPRPRPRLGVALLLPLWDLDLVLRPRLGVAWLLPLWELDLVLPL